MERTPAPVIGTNPTTATRKLRIVRDDNLRSDLRAQRKEITTSGNIRFAGEVENSHCDRTWAMALRQHASRHRVSGGGAVRLTINNMLLLFLILLMVFWSPDDAVAADVSRRLHRLRGLI